MRIRRSFLGLAALVVLAAPSLAEYRVIEEVVAVVEDEIITRSDVEEQLQLLLVEMQLDPRQNPGLVDSLRTDVLQQLVDNTLVVKEAERLDITVPDQELEARLEQQIRSQVERFGGEDQFEQQLRAEGVTLKQMRRFYREDLRRQILASELIRTELDTDIEVTDADVQAYYDEHRDELPPKPAQVRLRHLVVAVKPSAERELEMQETLENARYRIMSGEDFCEVAREVSQDPTAERWGDLGLFGRGDLDPAFTRIAFALPDSGVSEVVRTGYGYHVIQRLGSQGERVRARHIVIPHQVSEEDRKRAQGLITTVTARLEEGADFIDLVRAYSDATERDGDVGYVALDELFPRYRGSIADLEIGEVSDVVVDDQGYHMFQLLDRREAGAYTLDEVRDRLRELVRRDEINRRYKTWVEKLAERSYVDVRGLGSS